MWAAAIGIGPRLRDRLNISNCRARGDTEHRSRPLNACRTGPPRRRAPDFAAGRLDMGVFRNVGVRGRTYVAVVAAVLAFAAAPAAAQNACIGDCNANKQVTIEELLRGVNIALGGQAVAS